MTSTHRAGKAATIHHANNVGAGKTAPKHAAGRSAEARSVPAVIVIATALVALLNYAFALILLWVLPADKYAVVASITALLLMFGTVAGASAPWVLAREVAVSAGDNLRRQHAIAFAGIVALGQAALAAAICEVIVSRYATSGVALITCSAVVAIFIAAAAVGYLQGTERFRLIAVLRIIEVIVKIVVGATLVKLGLNALGAISGFTFGALLVLLGAGYAMRSDMIAIFRSRHQRWARAAVCDRRLWASTRGIIGIQALTAVIASLDLVIASIMLSGDRELANYQVAQVLGRIPFYIASSLAIIVFPRMARLWDQRGATVASSIRVWIRVCGAATVIVATIPQPILIHILPTRYGSVSVLLPWAALTGFGLGGINLVTTYWQAVGNGKGAIKLLLIICFLSGSCDVLSLLGGNTRHLAWSATLTTLAGLCALLALVRRDWVKSLRGTIRHGVVIVLPGAALLLLRTHVVAWIAVVLVGVTLPALRSLWVYGSSLAASQQPRILHLAFEDPLRPGAGGGSVRTQEIDRRLARNFKVTVVCARYRGSQPRKQDGVLYVHVGLPWGQKLSLLSYFLCLPWAVVRYPGELVIEDFAAPFSSVAVPWLTSRPVIGVVQWLFAQQKKSEYGLPFHLVEKVGLASHRHLIAVSEDLGAELRNRNPRAQVSVVENGLPAEAFLRRDLPRSNILFLGRLEESQKGIDLLMRAFACIAGRTDRTLTVAGSGPDEARIRALAESLGVGNRVLFLGHVAPSERFDLLASAELVAMPSRYETFGMVAAEALAVGTPVVAFDIPCLRSILSPGCGILVPAFDTDAFAAALVRVLDDDQLRSRLARAGRAMVNRLSWDGAASVQENLYSRVLIGAQWGDRAVEPLSS
jgi:glycosyltransferase involved in cell wall biosynthesis/O-antigen/teichoic acid export membrane protein